MQAPELNPCPFCGGKANVSHDHDDERSGYRESWYVNCEHCQASTAGSYYYPYGEWAGSGKPKIEQDRDKQMTIAYDNWNRRISG